MGKSGRELLVEIEEVGHEVEPSLEPSPTSAPSPNRKPSLKRVDALWKRHAESTPFMNFSAAAASSVMIASVWPDPYMWMWSIAVSIESTISSVTSSVPYSMRGETAIGSCAGRVVGWVAYYRFFQV
jgi:hypothetical protein